MNDLIQVLAKAVGYIIVALSLGCAIGGFMGAMAVSFHFVLGWFA